MTTSSNPVACPKCGAVAFKLDRGQEIRLADLDSQITCGSCGHAFNFKEERGRIALEEAREAFHRRRKSGR